MKRKLTTVFFTICIVLIGLFSLVACNQIDTKTDYIKNGGFENLTDSDKKFENWTFLDSNTGNLKISSPGSEDKTINNQSFGKKYLTLDNGKDKTKTYHSQIFQKTKVKKNHYYRLKISYRYELEKDNPSANITKEAHLLFNGGAAKVELPANDKWQETEIIVKAKSRDFILGICLGSENSKTKGKLHVDNVSMHETKLGKNEAGKVVNVASNSKSGVKYNTKNVQGIILIVFASLLTVAIVVTAYVFLRRLYNKREAFNDFKPVISPDKNPNASAHLNKYQLIYIAIILGAVALLVRFIVVFTTFGFGKNMMDFFDLSKSISKTQDLTSYYVNNKSSNYAPGFLYLASILGAFNLKKATDFSILVRMINVLFDVAIVLIIYFYGRKKVGNKLSTIYSALYALLPLTFIFSSMSNVFTSITICFSLVLIILVVEKQYIAFYSVLPFAIIFDLRVMAILPVIAVGLVFDYIKDEPGIARFTKNRAVIVFGVLTTFILVYILTLPIAIKQIQSKDAFYGYKAVANVMMNTNTFVINSLNLYALAGMNGEDIVKSTKILNIIFILVFEIFVLSLYLGKKNRLDLFLLGALTYSVMAILTMKVDYTYLILPIALLMIHTMISGDRRLYFVFAIFAFVSIVNIAQIINLSHFVGGKLETIQQSKLALFDEKDPFMIFFSIITILTLLYYMYVSYSISVNRKIVDIKPMNSNIIKYFGRKIDAIKQYNKDQKEKRMAKIN